MSHRVRLIAPFAAAAILLLLASAVAAHEVREVSGYQLVVGFIDEPVYTNQKSGLEFQVTRNGEPVEGLEETLNAEVTFDGERRELPLTGRFGAPGWYESVFFPTAAGPYTFRISGQIEDQEIDESFTSSPDGFNEVQDATGGQFPVAFPPIGDIARDAQSGAAASSTATIALVLGGAGLITGLVALGIALSRRRAT
jgi:hypothetical protein